MAASPPLRSGTSSPSGTTQAASDHATGAASGRYGAAHGVFSTIYDVGDAAGPIGAGILVAAIGYGPMFRTLSVFGLLVAVVFAIASRPVQMATLPEPRAD